MGARSPRALAPGLEDAVRRVAHDAFRVARQALKGAAGSRRAGKAEGFDGGEALGGRIALAADEASASQGYARERCARLDGGEPTEHDDERLPSIAVPFGLEASHEQNGQDAPSPHPDRARRRGTRAGIRVV